ncbi:MAG TPA: DNA cytosine methyltransferase, partial [Candidatus Dormibacteraeota bacterium]|nr:DNA cytosine methyltransferase [Candidatus Dormibacteraeota bacterium]
AGIDNDPTCKFGYETNNKARFITNDIANVSSKEIADLFKGADIRVLVGCAPCQPYSGLNRKGPTESKMAPLKKFAEYVAELRPEIVSMENVRGLATENKYPVFKDFLRTLETNGYHYKYVIVDTSDYGVPQKRHRLVLLASRLGPISLILPTHKDNKVTVRDAIGNLPPVDDGEAHTSDPLHRAVKMNALNKKRIMATPANGGDASAWDTELLPDCYRRESGKSYMHTVYGRMRWEEPSPTMTTNCTGFGNGRFGHPEQHRAITLREAARFQTFPDSYRFTELGNKIPVTHLAKFIGNAVPVQLGQVIAQSINQHLNAALAV